MPSPFSWGLSGPLVVSSGTGSGSPVATSLLGIKLDPLTGDVSFDDDELGSIDGSEYALQKVQQRLKFFLGEWFLDARQGMPYYRDVLVKNPNRDVVRSDFRRAILSVPGITVVRRLEIAIATATRELSVDWEALYQEAAATPEIIASKTKFIIGNG